MFSFKGNIKDMVRTFENEAIITITTNASNLSWEELKGLEDAKNGLKIDISKWREKRPDVISPPIKEDMAGKM